MPASEIQIGQMCYCIIKSIANNSVLNFTVTTVMLTLVNGNTPTKPATLLTHCD